MLSVTMNRIKLDLKLAGISASNFATICDVPPSSMREAFQGQRYFGGPMEAELSIVASKCRQFVEALGPLTSVI